MKVTSRKRMIGKAMAVDIEIQHTPHPATQAAHTALVHLEAALAHLQASTEAARRLQRAPLLLSLAHRMCRGWTPDEVAGVIESARQVGIAQQTLENI